MSILWTAKEILLPEGKGENSHYEEGGSILTGPISDVGQNIIADMGYRPTHP